MSSQCFPLARQKFLRGQLDWLAGTLRCVLLPESFVVDFEAEFLSDIAAGSRIAISQAITGRTADLGYAFSDAILFPQLVDNRRADKAIIYKDTGNEATSALIFLMEEPNLIPVPFALQGFDYYIYPNAAEGGFFRL